MGRNSVDYDSSKENETVVEQIENMEKPEAPTTNKTTSSSIDMGSSEELETNEHTHLTLKESLKKWRTVVFYSMCMASAILMYGYDYVIVGTTSAMPSFLHDYGIELNGKWILPSMWLSLWTFISPGCAMIGAVAGGFFQDRFGRRWSLALGSLLCAVGVAVCFVSNRAAAMDARRGIFLAGKGFQGGAIGMVMATAQTHMSEMLPPNLRGPVLAFFPIFTLLGQVVGAVVIYACLNHPNGYAIAFATQWPFSALPLIMAFVVPESPTYLVRKGLNDAAYAAQRKLDGKTIDEADTRRTLDRLRAHIEHEKRQPATARATYRDSFRAGGGNLRRTLIVMFASVVPQLFGLTLLAKASYFIQIVGMQANLSVIVLILGIVCGLLANIASLPVLARFGRRPLLMVGLSVAALWWGTMGIAGIWKDSAVTVWYSAAMMILVTVCCGLSAWPAATIVCSEASALHLRAKAQGVGWFTNGAGNAVFGFVLPYIFNPDEGNLGAKTGFVFAGLCLLAVAITFWAVPEMKGRTPAEIDRMFELGLSARAFAAWKNPSVPQPVAEDKV